MTISHEKETQQFVEDVLRTDTNTDPKTQHVPLWQSVKKWPRVIAYCLILSSAILLYGYDLVIVGSVSAMPSFQQHFGEKFGKRFIIPSMWLSLWNVASPIGMMLGSIIGGQLQDRGGRRISLATGAFLSAIAVAICYVADLPDEITARRGVFFVGKFFQGVCLGILLCVVQTYMSEVLPVLLRGPIIAFLPIFTLLGQLIGSVVVYTSLKYPGAQSYRIPFASQWPFSAVTFVLAAIIPESPIWLLRRGSLNKALKAQKRLESPGVDSEAIIEDLRVSILAEEETRATSTYADCFRGVNLRRTLVVALANCLPQLFGLQLLANASYFAQIVGMASANSLIFLILGIGLGLIANIGSLWVLNAFGRRFLVLVTLSITLVLWLAMGIAGCFDGVVTIWYASVTMMIVTMICGLGIWPASHVIAAETSSLQLRAKTQGIGWFVSGVAQGVFSISLPYIYNLDAGNLKAKTGFVMAGFAAIAIVATWIWVPEMKGRSPMEIDRMFSLSLKTRDFKNWRSDVVMEKHIDPPRQSTGV
ncbi:Major facilitator superfamily domain general substrate transporter [Penicillium atrosanguineum]|uniref:Major facilitator superfamily domain general substrate transporter n=1 Tax=Penicillium atrosanguineum TaxID=1132637 RepID=A0A9W9GF75_9EURO|nr:uncharacterized protein N7443_007228 [Penicillium atrosanguineum]KAJ5118299.1 Major facilitator superfamily domain general substrate transporter [Penicillium atrosanguineum]KAJ5119343.1 Major facilitator superfamily domain general substrate transporter [Penicillium atrosanguineum]KAJ5296335.1 hypothetical protein N7443_007228 [Penicillium atrosanguineum]KAJ5299104.1 Major facilitator superfamily domain general substrate transporter [Penicillium atrosanguineum]